MKIVLFIRLRTCDSSNFAFKKNISRVDFLTEMWNATNVRFCKSPSKVNIQQPSIIIELKPENLPEICLYTTYLYLYLF